MSYSSLTEGKLRPLVEEAHKRKASFLEITNASLRIALVSVRGINEAREENVDVPPMVPLARYHEWYYNFDVEYDDRYFVTDDQLGIDELRSYFGVPAYHEIYVKATYKDRFVPPWKFKSTLSDVDFPRICSDALEFESVAGQLLYVEVQRSCTSLAVLYPPGIVKEIEGAGWRVHDNLLMIYPGNLIARLKGVFVDYVSKGDEWGLLLNKKLDVESLIKDKELKTLYL